MMEEQAAGPDFIIGFHDVQHSNSLQRRDEGIDAWSTSGCEL
jgi:hypothetical protein